MLKDAALCLGLAAAMLFASGAFAESPGASDMASDTEICAETSFFELDVEVYAREEKEAYKANFELATAEPEPASEEVMPALYTERDVELLAKVIWAEARGVDSDAEKAAVAWCALNRLDAGFGATLEAVLTAPHQFAYRESAPVTPELEALARDVLERWQAEKYGAEDVGRTLPADYYFFGGDGRHNYFRKEYRHTGENWDWSLPSPYEEDETT